MRVKLAVAERFTLLSVPDRPSTSNSVFSICLFCKKAIRLFICIIHIQFFSLFFVFYYRFPRRQKRSSEAKHLKQS